MSQVQLTKQQQDDLKFIKNPQQGSGWPNWPYLPMKRTNPETKQLEGGHLFERGMQKPPDVPPIVYLISFWELIDMAKKGSFKRSDLPSKTYNSIEEMLADGWQVD